MNLVASSLKTEAEPASSLTPADAPLTGQVGILIPAFNEAATVASIVEVALEAQLGVVLVVDDGSKDATATRALEAGAAVLQLHQNRGKGGAVFAGAQRLQTDVIALIDADLTGFTAEHLHALVNPVLAGQADMTRGVFMGGRWRTTAAQQITPQLNGQRALLRKNLLALPDFKDSRYGIEIIITQGAKEAGWHSLDVPLYDVSQVMKEEKRGFWAGLVIRLGMYRDVLKALLK